MSALSGARGQTIAARPVTGAGLHGAMLWLTGLAGAFVLVEPSPYEVIALATAALYSVTGLSLRPALAPLIVLLLLLNAGYVIALLPVIDQPGAAAWVLVSAFLAISTIFFAAMLGIHTQARLDWLMRGYAAAAMIASFFAIGGYFRLFESWSDLFVLYDRARGTFKDPNVLGAFLVLPGLLAFQRVLVARPRAAIASGVTVMVFLAALLLSFSRAAWGQFAFAALIVMGLTFLTSRSANERARIALITLAGVLAIALFIAVLLSIEPVAALFTARASLEQSYDIGPMGRFGRYLLAVEFALDHPFGVGPLQFARLLQEAPHNVYLNSFMAGGWLAGFAYLTLTAVTVVMGLRYVLVATPWRRTYHAVYAAYLGVVTESLIVDSDHWRHYFLILGVLWGLMSATRVYRPLEREAARIPAGPRPGLSVDLAPALAPVGSPR
jgi:O-antigen ligase